MPLTTPTGLFRKTSRDPGDTLHSPDPARSEGRRRLIVFAGLGIVCYAAAMVATMPASVFVKNQPWRTGVAGTVWNGEVGVAGGSKVEWHWAPLRSLTSLGFAADWTATGPDTDLGGRILTRPGRTILDSVSGSAHASLLQAAYPGLGFGCDVRMNLDFERIAIGGSTQSIEGRGLTEPGTCTADAVASAPVAVGALSITAEHIGTQSLIRLTPADQRRQVLIEGKLAESGPVTVRMTPQGASALPFMGIPGGVSIETEL